jgi:hypothetical protein
MSHPADDAVFELIRSQDPDAAAILDREPSARNPRSS